MRCSICKNASDVLIKLKDTAILQCKSCNHKFSDIQANIDIYNDTYFNKEHKNFFENQDITLFRYIMRKIIELKGKKVRILDVGCGKGSLLKFLLENGFNNLHGVDLIENSYDKINFIKQDLFGYETKEKFDIVISVYTIEHIDEVGRYIEKLKTLLKKDGSLIIVTVNECSPLYSIAKALYTKLGIAFACERLYDTHHINHFSINSLRLLGERHGLEPLFLFEKNYPFKAIDLPKSFFGIFTKINIFAIFLLSSLLGKGISQTQIFKLKN